MSITSRPAAEGGRRGLPNCCFVVPGRNCGICTVVSLLFSVLLLVLGTMVALERKRFTPLYEDIVLKIGGTEITSVKLEPLGVDVEIYFDITNPNPFQLGVLSGGRGKATVGPQMIELGTVAIADTAVPARPSNDDPPATARAVVTARLEADLEETLTTAANVLNGNFSLYFELRVKISVEPDIMGISLPPLGESVHEYCGLQLKLLPAAVAGDVLCGPDSFEALAVPPLPKEEPIVIDLFATTTKAPPAGASTSDDSFSPPVEDAVIAEGEATRDLFAGLIMAFCFIGAFSLLFFVLYLGWLMLRARRAPKSGSGAPAEKIGRSEG